MALSSRQSRRDVLKLTAYSTAGALLAPSTVRAQTKSLTMMHESSFVPPYDAFFKNKLAAAYEKATGIKVNYEVVSVGSLLTRVTTAAENSSGPDMTAIGFNWAFLFDDKFVDVSDIAAEIGKESGGWYESAQESVVVNGKWKAIPFGNIGQLMNWRTDWFKQAGYDKFPDTWDELLEAGIKLKKAGHPFGFELGHGFGDNHGWLYPLLWSYGAREVEADGKTIVIDSDETARAVDYCRRLYKETMLEDCLGWTDVNNNKAFLSEQISCTNNAESILWAAKKDFPDMAKVIDQSENPKGPKGRFHMLNPLCHSIFTHTKDQKAAKDFLRWLMAPAAGRPLATTSPSPTTSRSCTPTTTRRCGRSSRATCPTAMRSRPRICRAGPRRSAGRSRRAWRSSSSSTCSPRPAPASRPRRSSPTPRRS